ncbi:hypothetical protein SLEP1_g3052 [Rubroshorea leprosula]|uniref:Uncharacterized protein n=1 Tax=Rubroshorea leprosula TaxID=152421 RepID=A0AAV5HQ61_9ROSI|nr:hypothetical protein SLEP1_g3052 [Rubroshorea leprosula]
MQLLNGWHLPHKSWRIIILVMLDKRRRRRRRTVQIGWANWGNIEEFCQVQDFEESAWCTLIQSLQQSLFASLTTAQPILTPRQLVFLLHANIGHKMVLRRYAALSAFNERT